MRHKCMNHVFARVRVALEWPPRVNLARDQRVPMAWPDMVDTMAEHWQNLLTGVVDMRTKLLNSYFFLIFDSCVHCKIEKGQKVCTMKQLYSIQTVTLEVATYTEPQHLNC